MDYTILQLKLFCQRSGKWDEMLYVQAFITLHNKDAGLKGNGLMVQRKGNLPVADGRSSEERDQEDLGVTAAVSMVKVPMVLPAPVAGTGVGGSPYSAEGAGGSEPELVSLPRNCQGTKFGGR